MDQISFDKAEINHKKRNTRREKFLEQMDKLIPWTSCCAFIACSCSTT